MAKSSSERLKFRCEGPVKLFEDNLLCVSLAGTTESRSIKHVDFKYHFIMESC
jgi:hypothetical protein